MDLNFILEGQTLKKSKNFPLVVEKSKDYLRIVVDGIPEGYNTAAYFALSWENGKIYDLIMTENTVVIDEYLTTLPKNPSEYVDYVLSISIAGVNGEGVRFTTNTVDVILDKTAFSSETENTPDVPRSQLDEVLERIPLTDQSYNPESRNAQSGRAVASALGNYLPIDREIEIEFDGGDASAEVEVEIVVDDAMSDTSTNPVENAVVKKYVDEEVLKVEEGLKNIYDYPVEKGTSGVWKYEKWNSGEVNCWATTTFKATEVETVGNLLRGDGSIAYPSIVKSVSSSHCNPLDKIFWTGRCYSENGYTYISIWGTTSLDTTSDYKISVHIKGTWK